jgi:hypothetical protein
LTEQIRKRHYDNKAAGVIDSSGFMNTPKPFLLSETTLDTGSETKRHEIYANNVALIQLLHSFQGMRILGKIVDVRVNQPVEVSAGEITFWGNLSRAYRAPK